ncbi:MAG: hypothetical protein PVJ57_02335 [Phycisphaerae bacterium]|jgi:hypothetical protein
MSKHDIGRQAGRATGHHLGGAAVRIMVAALVAVGLGACDRSPNTPGAGTSGQGVQRTLVLHTIVVTYPTPPAKHTFEQPADALARPGAKTILDSDLELKPELKLDFGYECNGETYPVTFTLTNVTAYGGGVSFDFEPSTKPGNGAFNGGTRTATLNKFTVLGRALRLIEGEKGVDVWCFTELRYREDKP